MRPLISIVALLTLTGQSSAASLLDLHAAIVAHCPIVGVSVPDWANKSTWLIDNGSGPNVAALSDNCAGPIVTAFNASALPGGTTVTRMQALVALSRAGILSSVQTWVASQSAETQLIWNNAPNFSRDSALLNAAATSLGLPSDQVDALFVTAQGVNP